MTLLQALTDRASTRCELCGDPEDLRAHHVGPGEEDLPHAVLVCATCHGELSGTELSAKHWFCLQEAAWSEIPAIQVLAYRLLHRLRQETWAQDLLDQLYIEDDVISWAKAGMTEEEEATAPTLDSNGTPLQDGDSVTLIKDLVVKGANFTAKRGTMVRNIRLIEGDPENIEGRVNKIGLVLKTCFLKKAG